MMSAQWTYSVGVFFLIVANARLYAQDTLSVDKEHMAGVVSAHLASLEGWRTGDFLVRVSTTGTGRFFRWEENQDNMEVDDKLRFVEGVDASTLDFQSDLLYRVVFDIELERCFVVGSIREVATVFDSLDIAMEPSVKKISATYMLADREAGLLSVGSNGKTYKTNQVKTASAALSIAGVPDIRVLGWKNVLPWNSSLLRMQLGDIRPDSIREISHVGQNVYELRIKTPVDGVSVRAQWDVSKNLPVRYWIGTDLDGTTAGEGSAKWKEINGFSVPVASRFMKAESREHGLRDYSMRNEVAVDVHWFSLNEELSDEFFQKELLHDQKRLDELLDQSVFDKK